jgi:hypothetical protein
MVKKASCSFSGQRNTGEQEMESTLNANFQRRKAIQASMESEIFKATKAKVEITMAGDNTWSICGKSRHAEKAMKFLAASNLAKEFGERSTFAGELFIYFKTGA